MFYFNGGLNDPKDVLRTAWDSYRQMDDERVFPIYMIWPTGAREHTLKDVYSIRSGRCTAGRIRVSSRRVPIRLLLDFMRGIAATPQAWGTSFINFKNTGFGLGSEQYTVQRDKALLVRDGLVEPDHNLYYSDNVDDVDRAGEPMARASNFVGFAALSPFRLISTPLIGPGEAGWRNMVRRTRTSVRAAKSFQGSSTRRRPISKRRTARRTSGGMG